MKIESYTKAIHKTFSDSTSEQQFLDGVSGIINVLIHDEEILPCCMWDVFRLKSELRAKFEGDVKNV